VRRALTDNLDGLSVYPLTVGLDELRDAIAAWFRRRYDLASLDAATEVLPVNGTREALFAFAQSVIDGSRRDPLVVCPNPFYQIYEGAALLAGARPAFLNQIARDGFRLNLGALSDDEWSRVQLLYVCSPGNPTGRVLTLDEWREIFARADRHGFVIASDECYSEIYGDEDRPPIGGLEASHRLGRSGYKNLVVFTSLSKRSGGRRRPPQAVSSLSHVSWVGDEPDRATRQHRGVARRNACARESGEVSGEVRDRRAAPGPGHGCSASGCRLLPVGAGTRRRR
jgi:N-succinyldiaminopimelate aminotransferase